MLPKPMVSVVVTTHNSSSYVADGLGSVLGQTFCDYEVVVVDDASSDDTCSIVERTLTGRCAFRLLRLASNCGGPAEPRNIGIRQSRGDWVALLDADDMWHPQKLEIQAGLARATGARFVSSEKRWFREPSETVNRMRERYSATGHPVRGVRLSDLRRKNFLCTASVLADRMLMLEHAFDPNPGYRAVEDYKCWMSVHESGIAESLQILTPLVFYRVSQGSISASKVGMVAKHWRLFGDYFAGRPWGRLQRLTSMASYGVASIYRQILYRSTRC